ncbi:unnamed protein product [Periconia digitata]|uniref:DNA-binding protein RAP1 n=1 Tax=Periconia digitata TaxID=1303443 RepID=A0A9W4U9M2_9PLEO|nr:unnamed protein product [Periconia digitata]
MLTKPPPPPKVLGAARRRRVPAHILVHQQLTTSMAATTTDDNVAEPADTEGQIFAGKSFWVAQRVISRNYYVDLIKSNGGTVIQLEKKADYIIADHCRRDCPPGSISYTFIERSIKAGEIQDPNHHLAGPALGTTAVASSSRSVPGKRAKYTAEEDRILYKWVRDCESQGGLASGNEIYKQLEAQHPQHPWQSWRDRYVKQLRHRPPSAFNIPDNALPSPPTDESKNKPKTAARPALEQGAASSLEKVTSTNNKNIALGELEKLFSSGDWEEMYAFKEEITNLEGEEHINAWKSFAEKRSQSATLLQQYFERIVKPQWDSDPDWKHREIKKRVKERFGDSGGSQEAAPKEDLDNSVTEHIPLENPISNAEFPYPSLKGKRKWDDMDDARFEEHLQNDHEGKASPAYILFAQARKYDVWQEQPGLDYDELHRILLSRWNVLSPEEKARFVVEAGEKASGRNESIQKPPKVQLSSTAAHKTPEYITEVYEKTIGVCQEEKHKTEASEDESPPPTKRQKNTHTPSPQRTSRTRETSLPNATQQHPFEISSDHSSSPPFETETKAIESDDFNSDVPSAPASADDYPSNTPTPRASRFQAADPFNTQDILSSPSTYSISALPLPENLDADDEDPGSPTLVSMSPNFEMPSDASTTYSLQEFRRSLNSDHNAFIYNPAEQQVSTQPRIPSSPQRLVLNTTPTRRRSLPSSPAHTLAPLPLPTSSDKPSSPTSSVASISSNIDPDVPLTADEVDDFFTSHERLGYAETHIAAALKCTRFRPSLATSVLQCWEKGEDTPQGQRGVWSDQDDRDLEGRDQTKVDMLERIHTLLGWGGVEERRRFLVQYRNA